MNELYTVYGHFFQDRNGDFVWASLSYLEHTLFKTKRVDRLRARPETIQQLIIVSLTEALERKNWNGGLLLDSHANPAGGLEPVLGFDESDLKFILENAKIIWTDRIATI